jgi:predicted RNase H-like HicB family nuclease
MTAYIAILEDAGPDTAVGVWFPDLPGCYSAGDTVDEALRNARDAIAAYAKALASEGRSLPPPRRLAALRDDPAVAPDISEHIVALIAFPSDSVQAAE